MPLTVMKRPRAVELRFDPELSRETARAAAEERDRALKLARETAAAVLKTARRRAADTDRAGEDVLAEFLRD